MKNKALGLVALMISMSVLCNASGNAPSPEKAKPTICLVVDDQPMHQVIIVESPVMELKAFDMPAVITTEVMILPDAVVAERNATIKTWKEVKLVNENYKNLQRFYC